MYSIPPARTDQNNHRYGCSLREILRHRESTRFEQPDQVATSPKTTRNAMKNEKSLEEPSVKHQQWLYLFVYPLFFISLQTSFLMQLYDLSLMHPASLISYLILISIGLVLGFIMVSCGTFARLLMGGCLLTLFIISIYELPAGWRYTHVGPLLLIFFSILLYPIRKNLDKFLTIFIGSFTLTTFFIVPPFWNIQINPVTNGENESTLPPYIHIVLDEHVGLEGIPQTIDSEHELYNSLKDKYIRQGFQVYGSAYSRYMSSINSFASFLNFSPIENNIDDYIKKNKNNSFDLLKNSLFSTLSERGYQINVIQNSYLNFCDNKYRIASCQTYQQFVSLPVNQNATWRDEIQLILGHITRELYLNSEYQALVNSTFGKLIGLSILDLSKKITSSDALAGYQAFDNVLNVLNKAENGKAYFVHLFLPHRAYLLNSSGEFIGYTPNQDNVYQKYLDQLRLTQKLIDNLLQDLNLNIHGREATIVIQGDHGSRICDNSDMGKFCETYDDNAISENFVQNFSTFFVARGPKLVAGYNNDLLPLDSILNFVIFGDKNSLDKTHNFVFLDKKDNDSNKPQFLKVTAPTFSHGIALLPPKQL